MAKVSLLLWDVGGVILSNAWDLPARRAAAEHFDLDTDELERRHALVDSDFQLGRIDLRQYLSATVFYAPRSFSPEAFFEFMRSRSTPYPAALATARALRERGEFVMAVLSNESRELNQYRIRAFRLKEIFHAFLSSCTTGRLKPDPEAYRYALEVTEHEPEESLLLDDRVENVEAAARLGLRTLWVQDPERVREELALAGIVAG